MSVELISLHGEKYYAADIRNSKGILSVGDLFPEQVIKNAIICTGNIYTEPMISNILTAVGRLNMEDIECHLLLEDRNSYSEEVKSREKAFNLQGKIWAINNPQVFHEFCKETIELGVLGTQRLYFVRSGRFLENDMEKLYRELKNII